MDNARATMPLKVYWQPGCSSCLRTKEFLTRHGVPFVSVNVREDEVGFNELATLGLRQVPIVARGTDWVNGQVLKDVARIAGIKLGEQRMLSPAELAARIPVILSAARRAVAKIPEAQLDTMLPNGRPQSYRQLGCHVAQIVEAFVDLVEQQKRLEFEAYLGTIPEQMRTRDDLLAFGTEICERFESWFHGPGQTADWRSKADVYYGEQTLHEFLERTAWHAAHHARQLQMIVTTTLGLALDAPMTDADLQGLPVPQNVWDDKMTFA